MKVVSLEAYRKNLCDNCRRRPAVTWAWFAYETADVHMRVCRECERIASEPETAA